MSIEHRRNTSISIIAGPGRAKVELDAGALVPRLIEWSAASARVVLVAGGALLLGGDRVGMTITVGAGCLLELEDIGGTVAYDSDGVRSAWDVDVRIAPGGLLVWHGLPFIVSSGSNVHRDLTVSLAPTATVAYRETIVLGRSGEAGGSLDARTTVTTGGRETLVERLRLDGRDDDPGLLGGRRVLDSIVLVGRRAVGPSADALMLDLDEPGCIVRSIHDDAHRSPIGGVWSDWRDRLVAEHLMAVEKVA